MNLNMGSSEISLGLDFSKEKVSYKTFKRIADVVLSFIGLIVSSPVFLIVAILIKLDSKGPVIFSQQRIGKNGKLFKFYKFRSMVVNADKILDKYIQENEEIREEYKINKKLKNDPRITKVGKLLRKLSLDELPQMINVLKGEMSIIGPRPYLPREKEDMGSSYNIIVECKPGITGYWQVSGRSDVTFESRLELESYYVKHESAKMDFKILFKTVGTVLKIKGAI